MRKLLPSLLFLCCVLFNGVARENSIKSFRLDQVRLLESPFLSAQQTDMEYIFEMDPDRLLAPYMREAGLEPKAESYGNWENSGLDGHIGGHYLSALAMMYASTGHKELKERLDYMIDVLAKCQQKGGYVAGIPGGKEMWKEIASGKIDAGNFSLNGKWVPLYNIHKLYAGLRDAYRFGGNDQALQILVGLSDWMYNVTSGLSDEQLQEMLRSEHGGMNEVLADVYDLTGDKKYLGLAERFSHHQLLDPLMKREDHLTGFHANTQIPKVIGFERIGELASEEDWSEAAEFFWDTVVENRTVSIGGNSVREHFNPTDDFSSMISSNQGPETCNTYNMLRLTKMLFLEDPQPKYINYYERALYNHILSSQHPGGGFVYFTSMRPRHYRVYSQSQLCFWCCVGSGIENHGKYGELIYAHKDQDIFVNLFIPSRLSWTEKGITLTQTNDFPDKPSSEIRIDQAKSSFKLRIRKPEWVTDWEFRISVNGKPQNFKPQNGYIILDRKWKKGDRVTIDLPMKTTVERLPDQSSWVSFVKGPIVLAAVTDSTDLTGLFADDSRMAHIANGAFHPIDEAPMLVVKEENDLVSGLRSIPDEPMTFSISGLVYPGKYKGLKLIPFYKIHEARYMLYWPLIDPENLEKRLAELQMREQKMLALKAHTIDQIATGEQQPESDHNFKGEQTNSGINNGFFWRDAKGWFSYDLINKDHSGTVLRLTYFNGDRGRTFDIFLNDQLLTTVTLEGSRDEDFYEVDYQIPEHILSGLTDDKMNLRFEAKTNSTAGGIYYIRLLRSE